MAAAPGYPSEARTVKSISKVGFNLVIPGNGGKFSCECANYRSLGVCSHAVAVAEVNGKLPQFVDWFRKTKKLPNLSKLAMKDIPKESGCKGGKAPRKKKKSEPITSRVSLILLLPPVQRPSSPPLFTSV